MLLRSLTIASFVYAIFAHNADQATAYYNSFARAWELLLGALVGALVPYVRWPMWLRTTVAVVALAAILSCGALIDGVKEFPGPWALVPVGATMLFILSAANRLADPHTGGRLPAAQPAAGHRAVRVTRGDGLLAVPVALAAADLLAVLHRTLTRQLPRGRRRAAGVRRAGLADHPLRRGPAAVPRAGDGRPRGPAAHPVAQADDRAGLGGRAARRGADRDLVHLARARHRANARTARSCPGCRRATTPAPARCSTSAKVPKLPMRPTVLEAKKDLPANHHRRLHQRLRQLGRDQLHLR